MSNYQNGAMKAYANAQVDFEKTERAIRSQFNKPQSQPTNSFSETFSASLRKVNDIQQEKKSMIEAFASGEQQNVHELMISLQKAGLAINMTSAVRNKLMEAYRELSKIQF